MKTFKQKKEELKKIGDKLQKSKLTVLTSFARAGEKGLDVTQMRQLKRDLRGIESDYMVSKKTIIQRVIKDTPSIEGSIGMVFSYGDIFAAAKALYQFSKKNTALKLFGAYMGTEYLDEQKFVEMAKLPTKEVLIGRLVGMLSYPIRGLVVSLDQIAKQRG